MERATSSLEKELMFWRTVVATPSERISADLLHAAREHIRSESAPSLATPADSLSFDDWESLQSYLTFLSWVSHSWLQPTWADHRKGKHKNRAATLHVFLSQAKLGRDQTAQCSLGQSGSSVPGSE